MIDTYALPDTLVQHFQPVVGNVKSKSEVAELFTSNNVLNQKLLSKGSVIAIGFGLMSPVLGMTTTMNIGLINGGPVTIISGFIITGIMTWICSLVLGEIISQFPTELHNICDMVADEYYKNIFSWYTAWLLLFGSWMMSTSITFAGAQLVISMISVINPELTEKDYRVFYTVSIFYIIVTIVGIVNLKCSNVINMINKLCVYWIIYAIIFIDILLLVFHSGRYHTLKYAITHFDNHLAGYKPTLSFLIGGFQQANFTMQGFSMMTSLVDETKDPEIEVPQGMSISVLTSLLSGLVFLIPIMLILPDTEEIISDGKVMPIILIFSQSTHSMLISFFLVLLILGNLIFSGISSITISSRVVYSMSRDYAIPYSELWTYTSMESGLSVPKYSILLSMSISYIFGLLPLVSKTAFNACIGVSVLCLCSATCIPLSLILLSARKSLDKTAPKVKCKLLWFMNLISIIWLLFTMVIISLPPQLPITFKSMNYSSIIFFHCIIIITILYIKWGKYHFKTLPIDECKIKVPFEHESFEMASTNHV